MLVRYSYMTTDDVYHGEYQCDLADYKLFYQRLPLNVRWIIVKFSEPKYGYRVWLWRRLWNEKFQAYGKWEPLKP